MSRLDEDVGSFWYSTEEEAAIVAALAPLEPSEATIGQVLRDLRDAAAKLNEDAPESEHIAAALVADRQAIEAIDRLLYVVGWMDDHVFEEDAHPMADHVAAARPHLEAIRDFSEKQREERQARKEALDATAVHRGNRFLWYRERLFAAVAEAWTRAGGNVDHKKAYRAFFEAALKPPLLTRHVQQITDCIWGGNLFSPHVQARMKIAGTSGTRGPKRKTQNGSRTRAIEM